MKDFTKADLKNRMVLELRNGDRFIVIDDIALGEKIFIDLDSYTDDLKETHVGFENLDVMKVYDKVHSFRRLKNDKRWSLNLIWQRSDIKKVTMSEVEEKFGCKVKIVKE